MLPRRTAAVLSAARPVIQFPSTVAEVDADEYASLAADVRRLIGLDLTQYKPAQVWRRVGAFATAKGQADWRALMGACNRDAALRDAFRDMLTINVSEFFRNPEAWDRLVQHVMTPGLHRGGTFRAWSAGCSLGFEPYTLAMLVKEIAPATRPRILATDVDATALATAERGVFPEHQMLGLSAARRSRYFRQADAGWQVAPEIRTLITFKRHDLLADAFERGFNLIACRNVVIYFTESAKAGLYARFAASLAPGGHLFVGATEAIPAAASHGLTPVTPGLFVRTH